MVACIVSNVRSVVYIYTCVSTACGTRQSTDRMISGVTLVIYIACLWGRGKVLGKLGTEETHNNGEGWMEVKLLR